MSRFYKHEVSILRYTKIEDPGGEIIKDWLPVSTVKGNMQSRSGNKAIVNDIDGVRKSYAFYCDVSDILDDDRIEWDNKIFKIISIDKKKKMKIDLKRINA